MYLKSRQTRYYLVCCGRGTVCGFGLKGTGIPRKLGQTGITGVDLNKTGADCVQDDGICL